MRDKFEEEKKNLLIQAQKEIESNIPLQKGQKKQLKIMLQFSIMRASNNDTVSTANLKKLANKIFKKLFVLILLGDKKKRRIDDDNDNDEDEEFYNDNLKINLNLIAANAQNLDLKKISEKLSPLNIFSRMKTAVLTVPAKMILDKIKELRTQKINHRETPEELLEKQRERERQRQRTMTNVRVHERSGRGR